ncbi:MAG: 4Fe-4S binding protein [Oscillospiraceae bacterium]|nr:4Fe-4S binding protein [Oscillospiraceae bacterium]
MKKLLVESAKCIGCGACELVCSKAWNKSEDRDKSAIRISAGEGGGYIISVCDQCGICKNMCSIMALETDKTGVVRLNKKSCIGCLICVAECVRGYMRYHDDLPTPFKCVACGLCAKQCPSGALKVVVTDD